MKKTVILAAGAALVAAAVSVFAYVNNKENNSASLLKANVEAMMDNESSGYDYPDGYPYSFICKVSLGGGKKCRATVVMCQGSGTGCNERPCPMHS